MIQKIFLITFAIRKADKGISFPDFLKSNIEDIKDFLPPETQCMGCSSFTDYYVDLLAETIHPFRTTFNGVTNKGVIDIEVVELSFSSGNNLLFKQLPWLEDFISYMAEEYYFIGLMYPYLIKVGNEYDFRLPYRMITDESNEDTDSLLTRENFSAFEDNALFLKKHFYKEEIEDDYLAGIAKVMLITNMVAL
jgi:hypothetical protein